MIPSRIPASRHPLSAPPHSRSERESYVGILEFIRDESGNIVRVVLTGLNTYEDVYGCVTSYEIEAEAEVEE